MQHTIKKQGTAIAALFITAAIFSLLSCATSKSVGNVATKAPYYAITCSSDTIFFNH